VGVLSQSTEKGRKRGSAKTEGGHGESERQNFTTNINDIFDYNHITLILLHQVLVLLKSGTV